MLKKFLNDLLEKIGAGSKETVYISVTLGVGLEMIQIDPSTKAIQAYAYRPLAYSEAKREIADYDKFQTALEELFTDLNISPRCNIILNLPMVNFGQISLPLLLNDESINEAIRSEVEQSYVFRRAEPVVSWFEAVGNPVSDTRTLFYSALQKDSIDRIKDILTAMGASLNGIEVSLVSSLRAMLYSGLAKVQMNDGVPWNLMVVNSTGYFIASMSGKNIIDYYEEPLALKTYEPEELYNAISASAQIAVMNFPANYLYVVSQIDMVSAEYLAKKLSFEGQVDFLEDNSFRKKEILPVSLNILPDSVSKISLEAIGIAASGICNYPIKLDFSGVKSAETAGGGVEETFSFYLQDKEIVLTESVMRKIALFIAAVLIIPVLVLMFTLPVVQKNNQKKLDDVNTKIKAVETEIKKLTEQASESGAFVVKNEIEKVVRSNRAKLISFSALGESVPKNLWVTYFLTKDEGKFDIKGCSENVEEIYLFFRNLKNYLFDTQLRLYKLEMQSDSIDDAVSESNYYEFEITNMSESVVNTADADSNAASPKDESSNKTSKKKSKSSKKDAGNTGENTMVDDLEPVDIGDGNS